MERTSASGAAAVGHTGMAVGFKVVQSFVVAVAAVLEATIDATDGSGAEPRLGGDIRVHGVGTQHTGGLHTARHFLEFGNGAKVFEEAVAVFDGFEGQDGLEQEIQFFVLDLACHGEAPFSGGYSPPPYLELLYHIFLSV